MQRRDDILQAAERLWLAHHYRELSMSQIAREARLAKGTLYLYFNTKEELFLELLGCHLERWLGELREQLQQKKPLTADECADVLLACALPQESLRRLLMLGTFLTPGAASDPTPAFRRQLLRLILPLTEEMPFEPRTNLRILMHLYALSVGWHQASEPPLPLQLSGEALPGELERPAFEPEFELACRSVIRTLAQGKGPAGQPLSAARAGQS